MPVTVLSQGTPGSQHKSPEFSHKTRENVLYSDPRGLLGIPPKKVSVLEHELFFKSIFSEVNSRTWPWIEIRTIRIKTSTLLGYFAKEYWCSCLWAFMGIFHCDADEGEHRIPHRHNVTRATSQNWMTLGSCRALYKEVLKKAQYNWNIQNKEWE